MDKTPNSFRIDYDGKWKILIEKAPKLFIQFFLSEIYPLINFKFPPKFMHQDVAKVVGSQKKKGDLVTDLIMEVHLLDGQKKLLYIHIEVQSTPTDKFGEKMFGSLTIFALEIIVAQASCLRSNKSGEN